VAAGSGSWLLCVWCISVIDYLAACHLGCSWRSHLAYIDRFPWRFLFLHGDFREIGYQQK
jgi:hypothetical protein